MWLPLYAGGVAASTRLSAYAVEKVSDGRNAFVASRGIWIGCFADSGALCWQGEPSAKAVLPCLLLLPFLPTPAGSAICMCTKLPGHA